MRDSVRNNVDELAGSVNPDGEIDVRSKDLTTTPVNFFFTKIKSATTSIALAGNIDDIEITVADASQCSDGDYIGVFNADDPLDNRAYFASIAGAPAGNVIQLDTPLDFAFQVGDTVACFSRDINEANGTRLSPVIYQIEVGPNSTQSININRLLYSMITDTGVSLITFGDLPKLVNGCVLRRVDGSTNNIYNIKDNSELANLCYDFDPQSAANPQQGQDGAKFRDTYNGKDKRGVAIQLNPGDKLQFIIQDDLTGLLQFRIIGEGHYVSNP